jgi:hypothetical protein
MTYTGTVGTALKLDDKDVNDPNSGFYTAQATTEQINNIPTDAKEAGELLYNKTTGNLMVFSNGTWNTLNSSVGTNGNIVINSYPTAPTDPVEGEVYYNTTTNTYQVYTDGAWQDITTSDTEIVAKSHATDPSSPVNGQLYYNTTDNALRACVNGAWAYVNPKICISLEKESPIQNPITVPVNSNPLSLDNGYPLSFSDANIISNYLLAISQFENAIIFNGQYNVNTIMTFTISGYCNTDTQLHIKVILSNSNTYAVLNKTDVLAGKNFTITTNCAINFGETETLTTQIMLSSSSTTSLTINSYYVNIDQR